ncbi:hypothetical protein MMC25_003614 [Agyrium rufum]|nr:hypothetical protein [Agyrium rufum]
MGSVVVSDVATISGRGGFPHHAMGGGGGGDLHQTSSSSGADRSRASSIRSYSSQTSSHSFAQQQRQPSSSTATSSHSSHTTGHHARPSFGKSYTTAAINEPSSSARNPLTRQMTEYINPGPSTHYAAPTVALSQTDGYDQSGFPLSESVGLGSSPPSPRLLPTLRSSLSLSGSLSGSPERIKVRDLNHIQSFASEEFLARSRRGSEPSIKSRYSGQQYEISSMPVMDIIEMVAGLLTKITTTNDQAHEHRQVPPPEGTAGLSQQATSVLAFHGKNVPSISIMSYLSRIHKYCPTTYEVFLSLLIYFDRMTSMINRGGYPKYCISEDFLRSRMDPTAASRSLENAQKRMEVRQAALFPSSVHMSPGGSAHNSIANLNYPTQPPFVCDSLNVHRLVIAGVTVASKYCSDVFYTNSRYAKVGGLPLFELNHLELQFLLLMDFEMFIPVEEFETYGSMLVEFYAEQIVEQQQQHQRSHHEGDGIYMADGRESGGEGSSRSRH